jgi:hypothetical protein
MRRQQIGQHSAKRDDGHIPEKRRTIPPQPRPTNRQRQQGMGDDGHGIRFLAGTAADDKGEAATS